MMKFNMTTVFLLSQKKGRTMRNAEDSDPLLGGGNSNIFYFQPYLGKLSNLTDIFQIG